MCENETRTVKLTPDIAELVPERHYRCPQDGCLQFFGNPSHLEMHLRKRHNVIQEREQQNDGKTTVFHCPVDKCMYHVQTLGARSFTTLRLLRQHYQKMHLAKNYKCDGCQQQFLLVHHLKAHRCVEHVCPVCGLTYTSKAALRTHVRRKGHILEEKVSKSFNKVAIKRVPKVVNAKSPDIKTEPEQVSPNIYLTPVFEMSSEISAPPPNHLFYCLPAFEVPHTVQVSTEPEDLAPETARNVPAHLSKQDHYINTTDMPNFSAEEVDLDLLLRDTETQTDDVDLDTLDMNNGVLAPLLRDIQTQTPDNRHNQATMTEDDDQQTNSAANQYVAFDEPMFGTQTSAHMYTQTCDELFEELGLSHIQTQTNWQDGLYNTQYTQTCDEMLDELLENFQSTYTQTRWLE
ncbi:uncharacterized protein LOC115632249 [Scaptodrosophila lebanonensis]|uniref:Uncharacterized protein LOC115632249 n=1 Tax=Drosophila lebanonensis TaxID=7225 RepID=A0A6J2UDH6_DROLE|nr:uncharacterized protein LOC115632249 [Scaptodrosophila lebanonensis]